MTAWTLGALNFVSGSSSLRPHDSAASHAVQCVHGREFLTRLWGKVGRGLYLIASVSPETSVMAILSMLPERLGKATMLYLCLPFRLSLEGKRRSSCWVKTKLFTIWLHKPTSSVQSQEGDDSESHRQNGWVASNGPHLQASRGDYWHPYHGFWDLTAVARGLLRASGGHGLCNQHLPAMIWGTWCGNGAQGPEPPIWVFRCHNPGHCFLFIYFKQRELNGTEWTDAQTGRSSLDDFLKSDHLVECVRCVCVCTPGAHSSNHYWGTDTAAFSTNTIKKCS